MKIYTPSNIVGAKVDFEPITEDSFIVTESQEKAERGIVKDFTEGLPLTVGQIIHFDSWRVKITQCQATKELHYAVPEVAIWWTE